MTSTSRPHPRACTSKDQRQNGCGINVVHVPQIKGPIHPHRSPQRGSKCFRCLRVLDHYEPTNTHIPAPALLL